MQEIDVSALGAAIDAGPIPLAFLGLYTHDEETAPSVVVEYRDGLGGFLDRVELIDLPYSVGPWSPIQVQLTDYWPSPPPGTRTIRYGGNFPGGFEQADLAGSFGSTHTRLVSFVYSDQLQGAKRRPEFLRGYRLGYHTVIDLRLKAVRTSVDGVPGRSYDLLYPDETGSPIEPSRSGRSLLARITECAGGACRRPTEFRWSREDSADFHSEQRLSPTANEVFESDAPGPTGHDGRDW